MPCLAGYQWDYGERAQLVDVPRPNSTASLGQQRARPGGDADCLVVRAAAHAHDAHHCRGGGMTRAGSSAAMRLLAARAHTYKHRGRARAHTCVRAHTYKHRHLLAGSAVWNCCMACSKSCSYIAHAPVVVLLQCSTGRSSSTSRAALCPVRRHRAPKLRAPRTTSHRTPTMPAGERVSCSWLVCKSQVQAHEHDCRRW